MIRSSFSGTTTGAGGAGMTVAESVAGDSVGGADACWAGAPRAADSQPVNAAAAKLRAREVTWVVDAQTRGQGYAKALEIQVNEVKQVNDVK